jgi:hypothetical protein
MGAKDAFDTHVRRKLEESFGAAVAMMILASATRAANVSAMIADRDEYLKLVDAICIDDRVVGMWGKAGADQALRQWQALV